MHYYQFHIGDYTKNTARLSPIEDIAYRRLLDLYYSKERPLNGCSTDVAREIGLSSNQPEVDYVLSKFFAKDGDNWVNNRAEREIEAYKDKANKASKAGKASGRARRNKRSPGVEPTINQEPLTNNHSSSSSSEKPAKKNTRGTRLPEDWILTDQHIFEAQKARPDIMPIIETVAASFRDYWVSKPGNAGTKLDWMATWRNWVRNDKTVIPGASKFKTAQEKRAERNAEIFDYEKATKF